MCWETAASNWLLALGSWLLAKIKTKTLPLMTQMNTDFR
jgi:hypothetical protein